MGVYKITYNPVSTGPEFSIIVADDPLEARILVNVILDDYFEIHVTGIEEIDLSKKGIVATAHNCC